MTLTYQIKETEDWYPLSVLFHESGLEVKVGSTPAKGLVKLWRLEDAETGALIAAAALERRAGVYTFADLAVRPEHRNQGYGKLMQKVVLEEVRSLGGEEVWGAAKVPEYYTRLGWERMDWDSSPKIAINCDGCEKRDVTCFPVIIRIKL